MSRSGLAGTLSVPAAPRARRSYRFLSKALLALAGVLLPVAVSLLWLAFVVLDTNEFTRTVAPIIDRPHVQAKVAASLNLGVQHSLANAAEFSATTRALITAAGGIDAIMPELGRIVGQVVASSAFRDVWVEVNRLGHVEVKHLLSGQALVNGVRDKTLTLTFADIQAALQIDPNSPIGRALNAIPAELAPAIEVLQQPVDIPGAEFLIDHASRIALGVAGLCALLLGVGLWMSADRRRALIFTGAFGLLAIALAVAVRVVVNDRLGDLGGVEGELAREYAATLTSPLESFLWLIAAIGAIVALLAWIWPRFSRHPVQP
jgi:hypothetical protein